MKYKPFPTDLPLYFVTSVIAGHRSIFYSDELALIPLSAINFYAQKKLLNLYAFCLMPNHLHALIQTRQDVLIEKQMGEVHKYSAHKIVEHLQKVNQQQVLHFFQDKAETRIDRKHLVWADAIAKPVLSEKYLYEVIEYIHNNPCKEHWRLVEDRADYRYSSAGFYDRGAQPIIPVVDIREVWFELGNQLSA
ncbi:MAG TPA: transposase [Bacteroidota bacterium]